MHACASRLLSRKNLSKLVPPKHLPRGGGCCARRPRRRGTVRRGPPAGSGGHARAAQPGRVRPVFADAASDGSHARAEGHPRRRARRSPKRTCCWASPTARRTTRISWGKRSLSCGRRWRLNPELTQARLILARIYLDLARASRAREELQTALERLPNEPQLLDAARRSGAANGQPEALGRARPPGPVRTTGLRPGALLPGTRTARSRRPRRRGPGARAGGGGRVQIPPKPTWAWAWPISKPGGSTTQ